MLFISHDLNVIHYIADRVAVMYAGKIMEMGTVEQVFQHPLHPYTKGLLASDVSLEPASKKDHQLKGEVALPVNPAAGCRLEPRCPIRVDQCKSVQPPLEDKGTGQRVACHRV
jgi:oligopeptide/dipeptide ABC transporter ATP-binding protein